MIWFLLGMVTMLVLIAIVGWAIIYSIAEGRW
jgi:hypothetical protein